MLLCGAGCCLWTRGFSGCRARPWGRAAPWAAREPSAPRASIGALDRCPAPPPTSAAAHVPRSQALRSLRRPPHRRRWGFCSIRSWLPACRRRVGSLMTPFPPFGGGEAAYVQVIGPACAGCVHRNRRGTHDSQASRRSLYAQGDDGGGTPKDPAPRYVR